MKNKSQVGEVLLQTFKQLKTIAKNAPKYDVMMPLRIIRLNNYVLKMVSIFSLNIPLLEHLSKMEGLRGSLLHTMAGFGHVTKQLISMKRT